MADTNPKATNTMLLGMYLAADAGARVSPVPHRAGRSRDDFQNRLFKANGHLIAAHRVECIRRTRRSTGYNLYSYFAVHYGLLRRTAVQYFHLAHPGSYGHHHLVVPSEDLLAEYFPDESYEDGKLANFYYGLVHPSTNPRFPFVDYLDRWDLIPPPSAFDAVHAAAA